MQTYPKARPYRSGGVPAPSDRFGLVTSSNRMISDGAGKYFPLGASFFTGLWMFEHDLPRCDQWLAFMNAHRIGYTRNFFQVNGASWEDRVVDPRSSMFSDTVKGYLDLAWGKYKVRTQPTMFASRDTNPTQAADLIMNAVQGREEAIQQWEITNESQLGLSVQEYRALVQRVRGRFPHPIGTTSPMEPWTNEVFDLDIANIAYPHTDRQPGDEDWRQVRQGCEIMGLREAADNNEGPGLQSSVAMLSDPLRLATLRAVGVISGMPSFCLHTGAGVRAGGAADLATGKPYLPRRSNIWEYTSADPSIGGDVDAVITALHNAVAHIPIDAPSWAKMKGHWAETRLFADMVWSDNPAAFDHGCVRVYGSYRGNDEYVEIVFGIRRFVNLIQKQGSYNVSVFDVLTGNLEREGRVGDGDTFRVEGDPTGGSNKAVVIVGTR